MKRPSFQFYPGDYLRDAGLRSCSVGARGLWMDMLCHMHDGSPYGHLKVGDKVILPAILARMVGAALKDVLEWLEELKSSDVYSVNEDGCMFSRRMVRDEQIRNARAAGGSLGGNPALLGKDKNKVNLSANLVPTPSAGKPEDEGEEETFCNREGIAKGMRADGFPEAWRKWKAYRLERGEPLTSYTSKESMLKCEREGSKKAVETINLAIEKSWKNLINESERNHGNNQNTNGQRSAGNYQSERTAAKAAANEREGLASTVIKP